ncbi:SMI1/KNR4 family protein [bacterium]|nr:SMI1/KNR4 family protein [bacterium]
MRDETDETKAVYSKIVENLKKLARLEPVMHGSSDFKLRPIASEDEVRAFETKYTVKLPTEYRNFITRCGRGGAGPGYGLLDFKDLEIGSLEKPPNSEWYLKEAWIGDLSKPFPYVEPWNMDVPYEVLAQKDSEESDRVVDQFGEKYWAPLDGAFPVALIGCGYYYWLVTTGPEAGHIWVDNRAADGGLRPLMLPGLERVTFLSWYQNWIDKAFAAAEEQGLHEETEEARAMYAQIIADVETLKRAKPKVFGADSHEFKLHPPVPEYEIAGFVQDHHIELPQEYRNFLMRCGRGGAGPYYGLFDFHMMDNGFGHVKWNEGGDFVGTLSRPFPFTEPWNDLSKHPADELLERDCDEYDRQMQVFDQCYWAPIDGAIPICHLGCALRHWLVVTGPEAGHVWADHRAEEGGLFPVTNSGERVTFLGWYRAWLDKALEIMKKEQAE